MAIEKIITRYLNKTYTLAWDRGYILKSAAGFEYYNVVIQELQSIFDFNCREILADWFRVNKKILTVKIRSVLDELTVYGTKREWVIIDKYRNVISESDICDKINDKNIPLSLVIQFVGEWKEDKIIEVSTKIMENNS
jgi:hypothetical protein